MPWNPPSKYETKVDPNKVDKFETGAQRSAAAGKGRFDLIPTAALQRDAIKYEQGAVAYGERNWERGMKFSRLMDSTLRHLNQYRSGDRTEDHLAAARWNIACIMHFEVFKPEMNDLPTDIAPAKPELLVEEDYAPAKPAYDCKCYLYPNQVCDYCQRKGPVIPFRPEIERGMDCHSEGPPFGHITGKIIGKKCR